MKGFFLKLLGTVMSDNHESYLASPQISRDEIGPRRRISSYLFGSLLLSVLVFHSSCTFDDSTLGECRRDSECASGFCYHNVCMPTELFPDVQTPVDVTSEPDATIADVEADAEADVEADATPQDVADDENTVIDILPDGDADGSVPEDIVDLDATAEDGSDPFIWDLPPDAPCLADADYCDGDILIGCSVEGYATYADCAAAATCPDDLFSCRCSAGECIARVCMPDTTSCLGNTPIQCDSLGSEYVELSECIIGTICLAGSCVEDSCEPDTWDCINDVLIECTTEGEINVVRDCGTSGHACNAGLQECRCGLGDACEDGETCSDAASGECMCDTQVCDSGEFCDGVDGCRCGEDGPDCALGSTCEADACVCAPGRHGPTCAGFCACLNGAACDDGAGGTGACTCPGGFFNATCGQSCACSGSPCNDGATGDGTCICNEDYYGEFCAGFCDTCTNGVCNDGATGNGSCVCNTGYYGDDCTICPPCNAFATCDDGAAGSGACLCNAGSGGDPCEACPDCGVNGTCDDGPGGTGTCICNEGFFGTLCDDACLECGVNGECDDGATGTGICLCDEGFGGVLCENACGECGSFGVCDDRVGGTGFCICNDNYAGPTCNILCDECGDHGVCDDGADGTGSCICQVGYYGTTCTECPCNGSPCNDGVLGDGACDCNEDTWGDDCALCDTCVNGVCDPESGACICGDGFFGSSCSTPCGCDADEICDNGVGGLGTCLERVFSVQRGSTEIEGDESIASIAPTAPTGQFFVRLVNTRLSGMGRTVNGAPHPNERWMVWIEAVSSDGTSITVKRNSNHHTNSRLTWELIDYTGASDGDNAIVVHDQGIIEFTGDDDDALFLDSPVLGETPDADDVVVFVTGQAVDGNDYDTANSGLFTAEWVEGSNHARFTRAEDAEGTSIRAATLSYAVVEFTGPNWSVERVSFPHTTAGSVENTTLLTDVDDISRALFHAQFRTGLHQVGALGAEVWFSDTNQLSFFVQPGVETTGMTSVVWVVSNSEQGPGRMIVDHYNPSRWGGIDEQDIWTDTITAVDFVAHSSIMGETARSAWAADEESVPRGSISLLLTEVDEVELYQCDRKDGREYTFSIVQWPAN